MLLPTILISSSAHAAKSWGITGEQEAIFKGTVIDITCELTGDCPENCGDGKRQLGLSTEDQGIILVGKNLTRYTGASEELVGFCGQEIEVDGLFTENQNIRFFQVQKMRAVDGKWEKADRFHDVWAETNGEKTRKAKKWYRNDPRVKAILEQDGRLGLGAETDAEFFKN
jgi:hypothetical protein